MKTTETLSETGVSKTKEKKKTKKPKKTSKDKGRGEEEAPSDFQEVKPDSTEPQGVIKETEEKLVPSEEQDLITPPQPETVSVPTEQVQEIEKDKEIPLEMPKDSVQIQPQEPTAGVVSEIQPAEPHAEIDSDLPSPKESLDITLAEETPVLDVTESDEPRSPTAERELPSEEGQMKTTETLSETGVSKTKEKKKTKKPKKTSKDKGRGEEEAPSDFQEVKPDSTEPQGVIKETEEKLVPSEEQDLITPPQPETVSVPTEQVQEIEKDKEIPLEMPKDSVQIQPQEPTAGVVSEIQPAEPHAEIDSDLPSPRDIDTTAQAEPQELKESEPEVSKKDPSAELKATDVESQSSFVDLVKVAAQEITKGVETIFTTDYSKTEKLDEEETAVSADQSKSLPKETELTNESTQNVIQIQPEMESVTVPPQVVQPAEEEKETPLESKKDSDEIEPQQPTLEVCEIQPTKPQAEITIDSDVPSPKDIETSLKIKPEEQKLMVCENKETLPLPEDSEITPVKETPVLDVTESDEPRSPTAERELSSEEGQMKTTETLSETGVSKTKEKKKTKKTQKDKQRQGSWGGGSAF
ncbi:cell surface glycoprotein 1-like [Boleophthalmus pectinirostris]|uniref:cell surface glycoprotein 1-like n=1 Tax=Boleophthalmus pectinirostris TaxID=150288 RepID=UPI00242FA4F3|nr:cell surface glycoprotein 1-like [Boleophthalmus pectinirostris]